MNPPPDATPTPAPTQTPEITPTPVPTATPEETPSPSPTPSAPENFTAYGNRHAVIASGYSGTETHAGWYRTSTLMMYSLLADEYGFAPENVYYLHEFTNYSEVDYEANVGNLYGVLAEIGEKSTSEDLVLLYLVGHGNMGGGNGAYTLVDGDVTGLQLAKMLEGIEARRIVVILTPCNSGAFISSLSGSNRVIMTSTEPPEANSAGFAEYVIGGLKGNATLAQAFEEANEGVFTWYRNRGISDIREHPLLDDNGDGVGHRAPIPNNGDGYLAANTALRWSQ